MLAPSPWQPPLLPSPLILGRNMPPRLVISQLDTLRGQLDLIEDSLLFETPGDLFFDLPLHLLL